MYDILAVKVVHGVEDLAYRLRGILLREFALLADAVEELTACRQLRHDVVFVLSKGPSVCDLSRYHHFDSGQRRASTYS